MDLLELVKESIRFMEMTNGDDRDLYNKLTYVEGKMTSENEPNTYDTYARNLLMDVLEYMEMVSGEERPLYADLNKFLYNIEVEQ